MNKAGQKYATYHEPRRDLDALRDGMRAMIADLDPHAVLSLIVENVANALQVPRCSISLLSEDADEVFIAATLDCSDLRHSARFRLGEGVAGIVAQTGSSILINEVSNDSRFIRLGDVEVRSIMSAPLFLLERVLGTLNVTSPVPNAFTSQDLHLLEAFADQAALAIHNAHLYHAAKAQRTELEVVLRGIGDGVVFLDHQFRPVLVNPAASRMLGIDEQQARERCLKPLSNSHPLSVIAQDALIEGGAAFGEFAWPLDAGTAEKYYQVNATTVPDTAGNLHGIVAVLRDATSQRELEQIKSNLLSVVSHELRTPLNSIKGFVDIILMGKTGLLTPLQQDFLSTVKSQTQQLQTLINELLDSSRLKSKELSIDAQFVALPDLSEQVIGRLEILTKEKGLRLKNEIEHDLPLVLGDSQRLQQVLNNLIGNAIKFTPAGGQITLGATEEQQEVVVWVSDTGIGIAAELQPLIFESFYQVDHGPKRAYKGFGLGLAISKDIIERHGGRIWVVSELQQGSTFYFTLPKCMIGREPAASEPEIALPAEVQSERTVIETPTEKGG